MSTRLGPKNIDLAPMGKKIGLSCLPKVHNTPDGEISPAYFRAYEHPGMNSIHLNFRMILDRQIATQNYAITLNSIKWDSRRPQTSFLRWCAAHEMGHFVQVERLGLEKFMVEYGRSIAEALSLVFTDRIASEKLYRETPFEAEADEYANKYWRYVKIKNRK